MTAYSNTTTVQCYLVPGSTTVYDIKLTLDRLGYFYDLTLLLLRLEERPLYIVLTIAVVRTLSSLS